MKKIIIIAIVIVGAVFLYTMRDNFLGGNSAPITNKTGAFQPDPSNATFIFDDESITLSGGRNEKAIVPGSTLTEETALTDILAYGDINSDNKEDVALLLTRSGGGSGTFIYLAAFVSGPVNYKGSEATFIGDRIAPQSITIKENVATVEYLDRRVDDSFTTEPTVHTSKQFIYKDGGFQEK